MSNWGKKADICGVYKITNNLDNKIYIGYSKGCNFRINRHFELLKAQNHPNTHLQNAWNKYGEEVFKGEIIEACKENELTAKEHYWCKLYNSHDKKHGYNLQLTDLSIKNKRHSEETKEKISNSRKGIIFSEITRKKMSITRLKKQIKLSKEHKEKLKTARLKRIDRLGHWMSEEGKKKVSESRKGSKMKESHKLAVSVAQSVMVEQYSKTGELLNIYKSITFASHKCSIDIGNISSCCRGKRMAAGGFIWKYK